MNICRGNLFEGCKNIHRTWALWQSVVGHMECNPVVRAMMAMFFHFSSLPGRLAEESESEFWPSCHCQSLTFQDLLHCFTTKPLSCMYFHCSDSRTHPHHTCRSWTPTQITAHSFTTYLYRYFYSFFACNLTQFPWNYRHGIGFFWVIILLFSSPIPLWRPPPQVPQIRCPHGGCDQLLKKTDVRHWVGLTDSVLVLLRMSRGRSKTIGPLDVLFRYDEYMCILNIVL